MINFRRLILRISMITLLSLSIRSIEPVKVKQVARIEGKPTAEYVESFVWENRTVQKEVPICCPGFVEMAGECKRKLMPPANYPLTN